jgi:hypothetical protein
MKRAFVLLQTPWCPAFAGRSIQRAEWLAALQGSRAGQRLDLMAKAAPGVDLYPANTTPMVSKSRRTPEPIFPAYIRSACKLARPDMVVAMGTQAEEAAQLLAMPVLVLPHPNAREITNDLLRRAGVLLAGGFEGQVHLGKVDPIVPEWKAKPKQKHTSGCVGCGGPIHPCYGGRCENCFVWGIQQTDYNQAVISDILSRRKPVSSSPSDGRRVYK